MSLQEPLDSELAESWMHQNLLEWIDKFRSIVSVYSNTLFEVTATLSVCALFWFSFPSVTELCLLCAVPTGAMLIPILCLGLACCYQKELINRSGSATFMCMLIETGTCVMTGFCCPRQNLGLGLSLTAVVIVLCNSIVFYAGRNAVRWRMFFVVYGWCMLCFVFFLTFAKAAIIYKIFTVMYMCLISAVSYLLVHQLLLIIYPTSSELILTEAAELARSLAVYTAIIALFNIISMMFSVNQWMGNMIQQMNHTEPSWAWFLLQNSP
ncbi:membrane protein US18 [macacine betaherpesvirus 3]|uniref:Rh199 n=1 Tax=Rhesus cytomegalovirus (strain 68-1) TaxID=47929 RepID=Q2FA97_RHCM6|nr:rhUS18 [macacine betaherpesvirus 3]QMS44104.1 Rh199 [synthetic construct]QQL10486.1 Rh199 [macacine betaherpesvirus 3]QQL10668.1 Rh199 [Rhesus cytomegalovirus strain 68-1.2]QQL10852.1 Rh199 [Rhesus cytomegalovirus strain 68-1_FL]